MKWLHKLLNPHCEHCLDEEREARICMSCEQLQAENARLIRQNEILLARVMERPESTTERTNAPEPAPVLKPRMPWAVKRQILEKEDRETAKKMKEAAKPDNAISTEELEKELEVVSSEREAQSGA